MPSSEPMNVDCACGAKAEDVLARLRALGWAHTRTKDGWVCPSCAGDPTQETTREAFELYQAQLDRAQTLR